MGYSVVIATGGGREESLGEVLGDWEHQRVGAERVVVVKGGVVGGEKTKKVGSGQLAVGRGEEEVGSGQRAVGGSRLVSGERKGVGSGQLAGDSGQLAGGERGGVLWKEVEFNSAARQRNFGAEEINSEWIVFCDDDVRFGEELAAEVLKFLEEHPEAVAVFPRMRGASHLKPSAWLRRYYGLQAGYEDETYGAQLFGAGISCYPCWDVQTGAVEANWLPSTMLWMKTDIFRRHLFPSFEGYSFGEDAHLTHRVWRDVRPRGGKLYFLDTPEFDHFSIQSGVKSQRFHLARMAWRNQWRIAREAMGKGWREVFWKSVLARLFLTVALLKGRRKGWVGELMGVWC